MRGYWLRIAFGALVIFLVGYAGVWFFRTQVVDRVRSVTHSADPIRIPLAFLPFNVDGQRLGTFQRLTIDRETPEIVSAFHVRVKLADSIDPATLSGCRITTASPTQLDITEGFRCLGAEESDSGFVIFGEVLFRGAGNTMVSVPLLLDEAAASDLRHSAPEIARAQRDVARAEAQAARAEAERIRVEARIRTDSIAAAVRERVSPSSTPPPPPPGSP